MLQTSATEPFSSTSIRSWRFAHAGRAVIYPEWPDNQVAEAENRECTGKPVGHPLHARPASITASLRRPLRRRVLGFRRSITGIAAAEAANGAGRKRCGTSHYWLIGSASIFFDRSGLVWRGWQQGARLGQSSRGCGRRGRDRARKRRDGFYGLAEPRAVRLDPFEADCCRTLRSPGCGEVDGGRAARPPRML
jgi:hypothetical protein